MISVTGIRKDSRIGATAPIPTWRALPASVARGSATQRGAALSLHRGGDRPPNVALRSAQQFVRQPQDFRALRAQGLAVAGDDGLQFRQCVVEAIVDDHVVELAKVA